MTLGIWLTDVKQPMYVANGKYHLVHTTSSSTCNETFQYGNAEFYAMSSMGSINFMYIKLYKNQVSDELNRLPFGSVMSARSTPAQLSSIA